MGKKSFVEGIDAVLKETSARRSSFDNDQIKKPVTEEDYKTPKSQKRKQERTSVIVSDDVLEKLKAIVFWERSTLKREVENAIIHYLSSMDSKRVEDAVVNYRKSKNGQ